MAHHSRGCGVHHENSQLIAPAAAPAEAARRSLRPWHATPVGIAALWQAGAAPTAPPYEDALKEGLQVGLDLSREEREFHQLNSGLVLLFHS